MTASTRQPRRDPKETPPAEHIGPPRSGIADLLLYAMPRFSDWLRRLTDLKTGATKALHLSPAVTLWLTLALIGIVISANSYFVGFQHWQPDAQGNITTLIPLGRADVTFRPMVLFPPLLVWLSKLVNFASWLVGLVMPDIPLTNGASPQWMPIPRPTVWNNATLALAWWVAATGSILISSTQGLFTRTVPLTKRREYAVRLNKINRIQLNPKAIAPAHRAVRRANNHGRGAVWGMVILAVAGWGWELFVADGALTGSSFSPMTCWIYGLASTFMAELCWFVAGYADKQNEL